MRKTTYWIENSNELDSKLAHIAFTFPCWVMRKYVEMDYSEITIEARQEDMASIENILAPLM